MSNNDSTNDRRGTETIENPLRGSAFERAVDRLLGQIINTIASDESDSEEPGEDVDTSDMPPLENIPNAIPVARDAPPPPTTAGSSSRMDVDQRVPSEHNNANTDGRGRDEDDMPSLLDVSDSEDSDAEDVEMLVIDGAIVEQSHSGNSSNMPTLEHIPRLPFQQVSPQQVSRATPSSSTVASSSVAQAPLSPNLHSSRRAYVEDDTGDSDMPPPLEQTPLRSQTDEDPVRIGSRRARVDDDDDEENGRRSLRSTNNATPAPPAPPTPTPAPTGGIATPPVLNNTPNVHPDRPIRPLPPRNGPPPQRAGPAFDAIFHQLFTQMVGGLMPAAPAQAGNTNAANQPAGANANANMQADPQSEPNSQPAPNNAADANNNTNEPAPTREGQPGVGIDMFFHFIGPDGTVRTHHAGRQGEDQAQPQNGGQQPSQPGAGQEQNAQANTGENANTNTNTNTNRGPANGVPRGFGGVLEQLFQAMIAQNGGFDNERSDPERAKKLVAGLEIVPEGLVKRLERVGGAPGTHEDMPGDPGCAVCWDSLLHPEEDVGLEDVKMGEVKEKSEEVTAESVPEAGSTSPSSNESAAAVQDSAVASASTAAPAPDPLGPPLPADTASDSAPSADSKKPRKEDELDSKIVELPCAHVFHAKCLIPWFSRPGQATCPVCRFNIDPENLTYRRSFQFRSQAPSPSPNLARAQAVPQGQPQAARPFPAVQREPPAQAPQRPPQPGVASAGSRPTSPQPQPLHAEAQQQTGPQPQSPEQNRRAFTFGVGGGNPAELAGRSMLTVNFDLVVDNNVPQYFLGSENVFGLDYPTAIFDEQVQPAFGPEPQSQQPRANANPQPTQAEGAPTDNNVQQGPPRFAANGMAPQFVMPPFTVPPNFFTGMGPGIGLAFGMGRGVPQGPPQARQQREPKEWTVPPAPGLTLRQRVEKKEREAGLRCSDISCGIGPTDDDPSPEVDSSLTDALKQISISRDDVQVKEPVCEHKFHPACLVSAGRIAGWGQHEDSSDGVEVSCPVCRKAGHIDRSQWDEGVRASMA